jgi:hypothetical protein
MTCMLGDITYKIVIIYSLLMLMGYIIMLDLILSQLCM